MRVVSATAGSIPVGVAYVGVNAQTVGRVYTTVAGMDADPRERSHPVDALHSAGFDSLLQHKPN